MKNKLIVERTEPAASWIGIAKTKSAYAISWGMMAVLGTIISLYILGFQFGISNNVFQIPYVLDFSSQAEFSGDAFYKTLRYFTSAVWPVIRLISTENNIETVFFAAHVVSRASAFLMLVVLMHKLGVTRRFSIVTGIVALAVSPWLQHGSIVGDHGMFMSYFAHSEFTWPFLIACLLCRLDRHYKCSALLAGITFSINAFVGIWLCIILGICWLFYAPKERLKTIAAEILIFLVVAAPVAIWIEVTLAVPGASATFSFIEYIRAYFPNHFLIEAATPEKIINLVCMLASGLLASAHVRQGQYWRVVLLACAGIFVVGMGLPYVVDARLVFNLHLLRVDGVIQLLSIGLIIAAALIKMQSANIRAAIVPLMIILAVASIDTKFDFGLIVFLLLLLSNDSSEETPPLLVASDSVSRLLARFATTRESAVAIAAILLWTIWGVAILLLSGVSAFRLIYLALGLASGIGMYFYTKQKFAIYISTAILVPLLAIDAMVGHQWTIGGIAKHQTGPDGQLSALANWIRTHPIHGIVLLSKDAVNYPNFQLESRNSVWVDQKQGAAVMWYPPFYYQWMRRYNDVRQLQNDTELIAYAKKNEIPFVLLKSPELNCPEGLRRLAESGQFILCSLSFR